MSTNTSTPNTNTGNALKTNGGNAVKTSSGNALKTNTGNALKTNTGKAPKTKSRAFLYIIIAILVFFILIGVGVFLYMKRSKVVKVTEDVVDQAEQKSGLLTDGVQVDNMEVEASAEESNTTTSGYYIREEYNVEELNPTIKFTITFKTPNDSALQYVDSWQPFIFHKKADGNNYQLASAKITRSESPEDFNMNKLVTLSLYLKNDYIENNINIITDSTKGINPTTDNLVIVILYQTVLDDRRFNAIFPVDSNNNPVEIPDGKASQAKSIYILGPEPVNNDMGVLSDAQFDFESFKKGLEAITSGDLAEFKDELTLSLTSDFSSSDITADIGVEGDIQNYQIFYIDSTGNDKKIAYNPPYKFQPTETQNYFEILNNKNNNIISSGQSFTYDDHPMNPGYVVFFTENSDFLSFDENNKFKLVPSLASPNTAMKVVNKETGEQVIPPENPIEKLHNLDSTSDYMSDFFRYSKKLAKMVKEEDLTVKDVVDMGLFGPIDIPYSNIALIKLTIDNNGDITKYEGVTGHNGTNKFTTVELTETKYSDKTDFRSALFGKINYIYIQNRTGINIGNVLPLNAPKKFYVKNNNNYDLINSSTTGNINKITHSETTKFQSKSNTMWFPIAIKQ